MRRFVFKKIGQNWLWFGRLALSEKELTQILQNDDIELYILRDKTNQKILGMAELDFSNAKETEIVYFGLVSKYIGKGLGSYLMAHVLQMI